MRPELDEISTVVAENAYLRAMFRQAVTDPGAIAAGGGLAFAASRLAELSALFAAALGVVAPAAAGLRTRRTELKAVEQSEFFFLHSAATSLGSSIDFDSDDPVRRRARRDK